MHDNKTHMNLTPLSASERRPLQLYYTRFSTNPATQAAGLPKAHHTQNKELARIHNELSWMPGSEKHNDPV
jgi:hypothetical protein